MAGAPVRSRLIFGPLALVPAVVTLIYTVPAGRTAVFRNLQITNTGALASLCQLRVNGVAIGNVYWIASVPTVATIEVPDGLVLGAGQTLYGSCAAAGTCQISGSGSLLDGVWS